MRRKERQLSDAVSQCDGRVGSLPVWPLGTEYRITLASIPSGSQLHALVIANQMRGWVGITFKDFEANKEDGERLLDALPNCHLFVEQDGRMTPIVHLRQEGTNHRMHPSRRIGRFDNGSVPAATG